MLAAIWSQKIHEVSYEIGYFSDFFLEKTLERNQLVENSDKLFPFNDYLHDLKTCSFL